ncbi:MAG: ATP-binding protein [Anaerolineae bacterium]
MQTLPKRPDSLPNSAAGTFVGRLRRIWDFLTEPHPSIKGFGERRDARLIANFTLLVVILGFALLLTVTPSAVLFGGVGLVAACYLLSRTQRYQLGLHGVLLTLIVAIWLGSAYTPVTSTTQNANSPAYFFLPILIAVLMLPTRSGLVYVGLTLLAAGATELALLEQGRIQASMITSYLLPLLFVSAVLYALTQHHLRIEDERRTQTLLALRRTELANADLAKANALARETTRLKSEFMATMSHELRTPLNAITGFCGIMLDGMGGEIDDEARHMVQRIDLNGQRLLRLINDILDLAKIEAGRLELVSTPMNLRDLSSTWMAQVSALAQKKGLTLNTIIDPALPDQIYGDTERLTQVVINLLSNALKFTESGGVTLELKRSEDQYLISVIDTGIGIPPHALNFIFEEFRQVDGSTRRAYGGTGLGLAIVRNLCRMMEGNIRVTSELGKGSNFIVNMPLKPVDPAYADEPEPAMVLTDSAVVAA